MTLPIVTLISHGEIEWSAAGRHTGRTDRPLTPQGVQDAIRLATRLRELTELPAFTSPLRGAGRTAELAGFGSAVLNPDLVEWDYGEHEGLTTAAIRLQRPGLELFRDGGPGGETAADVGARADRVVARLHNLGGGRRGLRERPLPARVGGPVSETRPLERAAVRPRYRHRQRTRVRPPSRRAVSTAVER